MSLLNENFIWCKQLMSNVTEQYVLSVALGDATNLAQTLSLFPQECLRRDRLSAFNSCFRASSMAEAFKFEWNNAKHVVSKESVQGFVSWMIITFAFYVSWCT